MKRPALFIFVLLLFARSATPYTKITLSSGLSPRWSAMPISYWINERGTPQILNGSDFEAIHAAFRTWSRVASADVRFAYQGTTSSSAVGRDGINMISFTDASTPLGSTTIAATYSFFRTDRTGSVSIDEADIIFSTSLPFSTSGESDKFDIQSVLTHEIGHLLGLDHSALVSSVMVPFSQTSQVHQRTLSYDDVAAISEVYPKPVAAATGQIRGFVRSGTLPVFGAHVVAVDPDGTDLVSTLSQPDGSYLLRFLPAGTYRIYAEPLDQPVTESNVGGGANSWYRNLKTDFGTTYTGNVSAHSDATPVAVAAGSASTAVDIQVLPKNDGALNLTRPAFGVRVGRGVSGTLNIGGVDLTAGTSFEASTPDIFMGLPRYSTQNSTTAPTIAALELAVSTNASLGPKNITVRRGVETSIGSGSLVVVDKQPGIQAVTPTAGPVSGGTDVSIIGANFREGASVYFAGLPAVAATIVDSTLIRATTPRNIPGPVNVQVINADGTNGLFNRGFVYTPGSPSITSIMPLSGPPATVVTISGEQFDTRPENMEVRFNGAAGKILSASATSIAAVVPYEATTGIVSLNVLGVPASGSLRFEVTAPDPSTNHPADSFRFLDGAAATGGVTSLSFNGPSALDDGLTTVQLPFMFSLFNAIYPKGTGITVSTNGWISMEPVSDPYTFQNARLPASSAVDSSGSSRTIPPSLIAPFHDDLMLVPNLSSVNVFMAGVQPNRQMVIQWTRMHILDETGLDVNASVSFEAILFEGSNDIQFLYESVSGPRSDGSSATVGLQNLARDRAVLTCYNQPQIRNGSYITYRFHAGTYFTAGDDTTPPTRPVVIDAGDRTANTSTLFAAWTADDPESGILEYQYAIGTVPGGSDVRPYTSSSERSMLVDNLKLLPGVSYFVSVRAVNNAGRVGEVGVSDGIRVDPAYLQQLQIIPAVSQGAAEYTGISLTAMEAMTVVLTATDAAGHRITAGGIQNPAAVVLKKGQQISRLVSELFSTAAIDGWVQLESPPGLSVYSTHSPWSAADMDASVARPVSTEVVFFHSGSVATIANPSNEPLALAVKPFGAGQSQALTIPARGQTTLNLTAPVRVQTNSPFAALERVTAGGKLALLPATSILDAGSEIVFPHAVTGPGYSSTLTLAAVVNYAVSASISFNGIRREITLPANSVQRISLADYLQLPGEVRSGAVRVSAAVPVFGSGSALLAALDVETAAASVSLESRPPATEILLPYVMTATGQFTGISIASGSSDSKVSVVVYDQDGRQAGSAAFSLGPQQQVSKLIGEFISALAPQSGGYIEIHASQPVWAIALYGSGPMLMAGPPQ